MRAVTNQRKSINIKMFSHNLFSTPDIMGSIPPDKLKIPASL